jgi:hypothetical protein
VVDGQVIQDDVVWTGPVTPYDGRHVSQSDALTTSGLCIMPAGHLAAYMREHEADTDLSYLTVAVVWQANQGGDLSRESKVKGTFMLYGPLDIASSMVKAVGNEADGGEMRVLREQSVRVSLCDRRGRNRVGGDDADLFFLHFLAGPSLQPQVCARAPHFSHSRYTCDATNQPHTHTHTTHTHNNNTGGSERRRGQAVPILGVPHQRARPGVRLLRVHHVVRLCRHLQGPRAGHRQ